MRDGLRAPRRPMGARQAGNGRRVHRKTTANRDAFQRNLCHTWKRMSCQTPMIRRDRKSSGDAGGQPSGRTVTYVPHDPSFERPDEGGPNGRLTGNSFPMLSAQPSTAGRFQAGALSLLSSLNLRLAGDKGFIDVNASVACAPSGF